MDWAQVLVIILALFLAVFLLAGIILVVLLIRVTHQIRQVTTAAQHTVDMLGRAQRAKMSAFMLRRFSSFLKNIKRTRGK